MKGVLKFAAVASMVLGLFTMSMAARAEHVQAETPWFAGVPRQSSVKGPTDSIDSTKVVWGTSLSVSALSTAYAGTLTVKLTDFNFPAPLKSLSLLVTDLNGFWERIDGATGPDGLTFDLSGPAKLFVAVFAQTNSWSMPGAYNLQASFAPVPLPAAAWLLLSGLGGLAAFRRKRLLDR